MYLNKLIENDKFDQNSIQASDVIIVQMQKQDGKLTLKRLRAKNYDSGEYRKFMMDQVNKLGPGIMNTIKDRKYKWAEINRRDLSALETYSNIDNILNERNPKKISHMFCDLNPHFFDSRIQKKERHHMLGKNKKSFYKVNIPNFEKNFVYYFNNSKRKKCKYEGRFI